MPAAVPPALLVALGSALLLVIGLVVWVRSNAPPPVELTLPMAPGAEGAPAGAPPEAAYVHAAGAVVRPGLYQVPVGARVADVLEAAGGPGPDADVDQLNLAARVSDGERVFVPRRGEPVVPGAEPVAGAPAGGKLDLNTATVDQLEGLPGVGPATAQAIVDHRSKVGRFRRVDDLLDVRGIGPAKLAELEELVRV